MRATALKMRKSLFPALKGVTLLFTLLVIQTCEAQFDGFVLYGHQGQSTARLLDENGNIAHQWSMSDDNGYAMDIKDNGNLVRSVKNNGNQMNGAAVAGKIQEVDPNGNTVWEFTYSSSTYVSHHDICLMPNGNVLMIAWYNPGNAALQALGYSSNSNKWPSRIIEVQQNGSTGQIVWQWDMMDHFVQDVDPTKPNYGVISSFPERMDINVATSGSSGPPNSGDWFHLNGIDYNESLDQIAITSRYLSELYIIDHSTTTAEAATSSGGNAGMGGDFLYRWGNPDNYGAPGSQIIPAACHDVRWIKSPAPNAGFLQFVNNAGGGGNQTTVDAINPPLNGYNYTLNAGQAYGPTSYDWRHVTLTSNSGQSASDRMPDGNTFVAISNGYMYEVDDNNTVVWQYADDPQKAFRFTCDHPGIVALLGANPCGTNSIEELGAEALILAPNPSNGEIRLNGINLSEVETMQLVDATGRVVETYRPSNYIDVHEHKNGVYVLNIELTSGTIISKRLLKTD